MPRSIHLPLQVAGRGSINHPPQHLLTFLHRPSLPEKNKVVVGIKYNGNFGKLTNFTNELKYIILGTFCFQSPLCSQLICKPICQWIGKGNPNSRISTPSSIRVLHTSKERSKSGSHCTNISNESRSVTSLTIREKFRDSIRSLHKLKRIE